MQEPYTILGVSKTASDEAIKKAYRDLAKKYHPDLNPGNKVAENKFKEISAAYELIKTKELRDKYSQGDYSGMKDNWSKRQGPFYYETQAEGGRYSQAFEGNFEDIFGAFFNSRKNDLVGEHHYYKLEIDLEDAVLGATKQLVLPGGKQLKVKIPAGVDNGKKLKLAGQGGASSGQGKPGDAFVEITIRLSPIYKRQKNDFLVEVPLSLDEAINGGEVKVPTVDGPIKVKIHPNVDVYKKLKISGRGFPLSGGGRGDQLLLLKIVLPKESNAELQKKIREWNEKYDYNPRNEKDYVKGRG